MPRCWRSWLQAFGVFSHERGRARPQLMVSASATIYRSRCRSTSGVPGFSLFCLLPGNTDAFAGNRMASQGATRRRNRADCPRRECGHVDVIVFAGFFGNQDPIRNIAPVMIWIIGWVGLGVLCSLLGDVWALANPWIVFLAIAESSYLRWQCVLVKIVPGEAYLDWLACCIRFSMSCRLDGELVCSG